MILKCDVLATSGAAGEKMCGASNCPWANPLFIGIIILINENSRICRRKKNTSSLKKVSTLTLLFINCHIQNHHPDYSAAPANDSSKNSNVTEATFLVQI